MQSVQDFFSFVDAREHMQFFIQLFILSEYKMLETSVCLSVCLHLAACAPSTDNITPSVSSLSRAHKGHTLVRCSMHGNRFTDISDQRKLCSCSCSCIAWWSHSRNLWAIDVCSGRIGHWTLNGLYGSLTKIYCIVRKQTSDCRS